MFGGASTASTRAVFMTVGQLSFYDQIKAALLKTEIFRDTMGTHFFTGFLAVRKDYYLLKFTDYSKSRLLLFKSHTQPLWEWVLLLWKRTEQLFYLDKQKLEKTVTNPHVNR